jgi:hypothetical protein
VIDSLFEETIQFEALPQIQPRKAGTELPRPFQTHSVQQHPRHLRVVIGWRHMRREKLQLLCFAVLVEDFNSCLPARLRRTVQFPQIAECLLARAIRCAHCFDE